MRHDEDETLPELDPSYHRDLPELDSSALEFSAPSKEELAARQRWIDSGFRLGADLPPAEQKAFFQWARNVLDAPVPDPAAVKVLKEMIKLNKERARAYKAFKPKGRLERAEGKRKSGRK